MSNRTRCLPVAAWQLLPAAVTATRLGGAGAERLSGPGRHSRAAGSPSPARRRSGLGALVSRGSSALPPTRLERDGQLPRGTSGRRSRALPRDGRAPAPPLASRGRQLPEPLGRRLRAAPGWDRPRSSSAPARRHLGRLLWPREEPLPPARPSRAVTALRRRGVAGARSRGHCGAAPRSGLAHQPASPRRTRGPPAGPAPPPARPHSPSHSPSRRARLPAGSRSRASAAQSPWAARIPPRSAARAHCARQHRHRQPSPPHRLPPAAAAPLVRSPPGFHAASSHWSFCGLHGRVGDR